MKPNHAPPPIAISDYMKVIAISERKSNIGQITVGNTYYIDRKSIWLDSDGSGDAYGTVYDENRNLVGQMMLSHFKSC